MTQNKHYSKADARIFQGTFPVETTNIESKTKLETGDVIGVDTSGNFGKYDGATYPDVYGVAYEAIEEAGEVVAILTGGLVKDFVKFGENETKITLAFRKIGIFIK